MDVSSASSTRAACRRARLGALATSRRQPAALRTRETARHVAHRAFDSPPVGDRRRAPFYEHAKVTLHEAEHSMKRRAPRVVARRLSVSAPFALGMHYVVPRLVQLVKRYPCCTSALHIEDEASIWWLGRRHRRSRGLAPPDSTATRSSVLAIRRISSARRLICDSAVTEGREFEARLPARSRASGSPWRFGVTGKQRIDVRGPVRASTPAALVVLAGRASVLLSSRIGSSPTTSRRELAPGPRRMGHARHRDIARPSHRAPSTRLTARFVVTMTTA